MQIIFLNFFDALQSPPILLFLTTDNTTNQKHRDRSHRRQLGRSLNPERCQDHKPRDIWTSHHEVKGGQASIEHNIDASRRNHVPYETPRVNSLSHPPSATPGHLSPSAVPRIRRTCPAQD
ncbi:hypothetical protein CEXT_247151 [Caerostris extrusa]|uniref:Uncharacterized protein n=1 Tax=Caerostris extrusa TaxID=172846 RepID=A0AAV4M7T0_CAEEX|nr:hypothetical protein CEXT_247151 [Caerostris extrusa]